MVHFATQVHCKNVKKPNFELDKSWINKWSTIYFRKFFIMNKYENAIKNQINAIFSVFSQCITIPVWPSKDPNSLKIVWMLKRRMFIWFYVMLGNKMFVLSWAGCTKLVDEKCKYVA